MSDPDRATAGARAAVAASASPDSAGQDVADVVVVGGGITGLAAAYRLLHPADGAGRAPRVMLVEATDRLGGKIRTTPFEGAMVDEGADSFLLRVPWAVELCDELGLGPERISPAVGGASVVHSAPTGPKLTPLPDGLIGGVPTRLGPLRRSPLVGLAGSVRAAADYVLPPRAHNHGDASPTIGGLVRRRLGTAVADRVVDPLLGSISAGRIDEIDAASSAPILAEALRRKRSLMRGLRAIYPADTKQSAQDGRSPRSPAVGAPAVFGSFPDGMGRLVEALVERLGHCDIRLGTRVSSVRRDGASLVLDLEPEPDRGLDFDPDPAAAQDGRHPAAATIGAHAAIIAAPAHQATQMLAAAPETSAELAGIDYASVAVLTLSVNADAIEPPAEAGFLVARDVGWLTTACSYGSSKWPRWAGADERAGNVILRASVGRCDDDRHRTLSDAELRDTVMGELSSLAPLARLADADTIGRWRVSRWDDALPQYRAGHGGRVDRAERALARELPNVVLAGAAYRGLGVPACIRQGTDAALAAAALLAQSRSDQSPSDQGRAA